MSLLTQPTLTFAQQQTPGSADQFMNEDDRLVAGSNTTLEWEPLPEATRYLIVLSRDPSMKLIYLTGKSNENRYITPELKSGTYYYVIEGFSETESIGKTPVKQFLVGKPLVLHSSKKSPLLDAPVIVTPEHMRFYPDQYRAIRLAWEKVPNAKKYRVRLWKDESAEKIVLDRNLPPRWVTTVELPFIEVRDVPYGSFMYLTPGTYRWDVAAIDTQGRTGIISEEYFLISSQLFLNSSLVLSASIGFTPKVSATAVDPSTAATTKKSSASYEYQFDVDWWPLLGRGIGLSFGNRSMRLGDAAGSLPRTNFSNVGLYLLTRNFLSNKKAGWTFLFSAGIAYRELPEVISMRQVAPGFFQMGNQAALGPGIGIGLSKRFDSPFEAQLLASGMYHLFGASGVSPPFNAEFGTKIYLHWSDRFATALGLMGEYNRGVTLGFPVYISGTLQFKI